jgi:hypothetical protein
MAFIQGVPLRVPHRLHNFLDFHHYGSRRYGFLHFWKL